MPRCNLQLRQCAHMGGIFTIDYKQLATLTNPTEKSLPPPILNQLEDSESYAYACWGAKDANPSSFL